MGASDTTMGNCHLKPFDYKRACKLTSCEAPPSTFGNRPPRFKIAQCGVDTNRPVTPPLFKLAHQVAQPSRDSESLRSSESDEYYSGILRFMRLDTIPEEPERCMRPSMHSDIVPERPQGLSYKRCLSLS